MYFSCLFADQISLIIYLTDVFPVRFASVLGFKCIIYSMEKEETTYVRYYVEVSWTAVSYSDNTNPVEGQQFSVAQRFKEKADSVLEKYPVGQVDLFLLGSNAERDDKGHKEEIDYTYHYGVEAIIFDGREDNAPAGEVFERELKSLMQDNKQVVVKDTDDWKQQNPSVSL